jgi:hypothetical protein
MSSLDLRPLSGTPLPARNIPHIPVVALGMSLGSLIALTFLLCVLFDLWFPAQAMNPIWAPLFPGFTWLTWPSFFLGLIEAFAYGWYVALVFAPLYNYFAARFA